MCLTSLIEDSLSTNNGGIRSMSHLNDTVREAEGHIRGETNHGLRHYPTYSGATTGTEEDFVLEYVLLEDRCRFNCGVYMTVQLGLRHFQR